MKQRRWRVAEMFIVYLLVLLVKNYLVNLFIYMNHSMENDVYNSLKSALFQAMVLIVGAMVFFWIKYCEKRKESFFARESKPVFFHIVGFNKTSVMSILCSLLIGMLSYLAFHSLKNIYTLSNYYRTGHLEPVYINEPPELKKFVFLLFVFSILLVVGEELIYRGMMFVELSNAWKNQVLAMSVSIILFSVAHSSIEQKIQAAFLAIVLCIIMHREKSLLLCVLVHSIYNTFGMINTYYYPTKFFEMVGVKEGMLQSDLLLLILFLLIIAIVASTLLFLLIMRKLPFTAAGGKFTAEQYYSGN